MILLQYYIKLYQKVFENGFFEDTRDNNNVYIIYIVLSPCVFIY